MASASVTERQPNAPKHYRSIIKLPCAVFYLHKALLVTYFWNPSLQAAAFLTHITSQLLHYTPKMLHRPREAFCVVFYPSIYFQSGYRPFPALHRRQAPPIRTGSQALGGVPRPNMLERPKATFQANHPASKKRFRKEFLPQRGQV